MLVVYFWIVFEMSFLTIRSLIPKKQLSVKTANLTWFYLSVLSFSSVLEIYNVFIG